MMSLHVAIKCGVATLGLSERPRLVSTTRHESKMHAQLDARSSIAHGFSESSFSELNLLFFHIFGSCIID